MEVSRQSKDRSYEHKVQTAVKNTENIVKSIAQGLSRHKTKTKLIKNDGNMERKQERENIRK